MGTIGNEERRARVATARMRLAHAGPGWTRPHEGDFPRVTVPLLDCDLVRDILVAEGVSRVVEIGLAYGSSALAIGEALVTVGGESPTHLIIDPFQATEYGGVGWRQLQDAGLDTIATLVEQPSSAALPGLVADGFTTDAAFVDGSHRFHEVFLDLYYLRKIVVPGGLVLLDDHWWPSVRSAARYYVTNMGWEILPDAFLDGTLDDATGRPRAVALRLPDPAFEPRFEDFRPF
ncbi:class I SAM-dependent methyltransferase [Pseudonocardia sp. TRM90224]|uniref:class I SAM-dependent methyltransferase n=1 Tax=Pseudonocardia sp. TRM90224 TaxID=2812678 RepID=UPI001E2C2189|nr:class I SAM-dependent methyltransferase [Pseudonocardia sp. TRM90224]